MCHSLDCVVVSIVLCHVRGVVSHRLTCDFDYVVISALVVTWSRSYLIVAYAPSASVVDQFRLQLWTGYGFGCDLVVVLVSVSNIIGPLGRDHTPPGTPLHL